MGQNSNFFRNLKWRAPLAENLNHPVSHKKLHPPGTGRGGLCRVKNLIVSKIVRITLFCGKVGE